MPKSLFTILWACLLALPTFLSAQWEQVPNFYSRSFVKIDTFQNHIFAVEETGFLYRSDNHGLSWITLHPGGLTNAQSEAFAGNGNTFVVYTGSGIYRSEDLGETWSWVTSSTPSSGVLATMATAGGKFFVTRGYSIYRLDLNSGALILQKTVSYSQLSVYAYHGDLWITGSQSGVFRSTNLGLSWDPHPIPTRTLAFQGDTIYGIGYFEGKNKVVYSLISDPTKQIFGRDLPEPMGNYSLYITVANQQLYVGYWTGTYQYLPNTNTWNKIIPYWKNMRTGPIWSDGTFLFNTTSIGPARQNPTTGTWNLCNTGVATLSYPSFEHFDRYLFNYYGTYHYRDGVLLPGPLPVWITAHNLLTHSIGKTNSGFYAWDDSLRCYHSDSNLSEWQQVGKVNNIQPLCYPGRVFGAGDTIFSYVPGGGFLYSSNLGVDWTYKGLGNGSPYKEPLIQIHDSIMYRIDEYNRFYRFNPKKINMEYRSIVPGWTGQDILAMDVHNQTIFVQTTACILQFSGNDGDDWSSWNAVDTLGKKIAFSDFEICEAGIFLVSNYTNPGLFYAKEVGDPFIRLPFTPFDTLSDYADNTFTALEYVDGQLYIAQYDGQIHRRPFQALDVHTYSGRLWIDENENGLFDNNEVPIPNILVKRGDFHYGVTDGKGRYTIYDDLDTDTLRVVKPWKYWKTKPNYYVNNTPADTFNFRYKTPTYRDFSIEMSLFPKLKSGEFSFMQLHWTNRSKNNNATIRWVAPTNQINLIDFQPNPNSVVGDTLVWKLPTVYGGTDGDIYIGMETKVDQTPGSIAFFWSEIGPVVTDDFPQDNVDTGYATIYSAFDPNDKQVQPAVYTTDDLEAGNPLKYTIRFQNTGNAPASLVYIRDTIDARLDLNTLEVLSASHPYSWHLVGPRIVEFLFNPIDLPDSIANEAKSHGFIKYSILPKTNLMQGDQIHNTAYIYFDFNAPIKTNTTETVLTRPIVATHTAQDTPFDLFPNPSSGIVYVRAQAGITHLNVFDLSGRLSKIAKKKTFSFV